MVGDKKTPCNSIFLAVNSFDKARYKFYRRGLFECSSPRSRRAHEFRSLCEFVEALKKSCEYDLIIRCFLSADSPQTITVVYVANSPTYQNLYSNPPLNQISFYQINQFLRVFDMWHKFCSVYNTAFDISINVIIHIFDKGSFFIFTTIQYSYTVI